MTKLYIFQTPYAEYEMEGFNEWDARLNLRHEFGAEVEENADLIDCEFYSDGDDYYEDGIRRGDEEEPAW